MARSYLIAKTLSQKSKNPIFKQKSDVYNKQSDGVHTDFTKTKRINLRIMLDVGTTFPVKSTFARREEIFLWYMFQALLEKIFSGDALHS